MGKPHIDAMTWRLIGLHSNWLYESASLDELGLLRCPACGEPATVDRIPVGLPDRWLVGHWRCSIQSWHTSAPGPV